MRSYSWGLYVRELDLADSADSSDSGHGRPYIGQGTGHCDMVNIYRDDVQLVMVGTTGAGCNRPREQHNNNYMPRSLAATDGCT